MATPGERKKTQKEPREIFPRLRREFYFYNNDLRTTSFPFEKANEATAKSGYRRDRKSSYHDPIYVRQYNASRRECSKSYNYHEQDHKS